MDKVNDWNAWREYQKNGCQVMRPSGKSKCGRMPDAQPHAWYAIKWRASNMPYICKQGH